MAYIDGKYLVRQCNKKPQGIFCNICTPNSKMQLLSLKAIQHPLRLLNGAGTVDETKANEALALQQNTPAGALIKTTGKLKLKYCRN